MGGSRAVGMAVGIVFASWVCANAAGQEFRRLPVQEYRDKMKAGWIGQMAGVGWGGPTEFKFKGEIIPEDKMPNWEPKRINQFTQDDIYVEMTFVRSMEQYGLDVSIRQAGIDFANSGFPLWHANAAGRDNLRKGIAPPDCSHPQFNKHADDIDYQIDADYSGLVAPGLPNMAIALGEKFGRLMNYGDGLYGGQFIGGMIAEAFFETKPEKIVQAGLKCIPEGSQYAECIRDVLQWFKENPDNWEKTWQLVERKYNDNPDYRKFSCRQGESNIDAKINGAYVVMGLLYGKSDLDKSIVIACRCGQDSDCNPANTGGVLFASVGFSHLPERFKSALDESQTFSHTPYTFPKLIEACEKIAREVVVKSGGRIEKDASGEEVFVIPVQPIKPGKLEQCWEPGPIANSEFTEEEMKQIKPPVSKKGGGSEANVSEAVEKFAPGWSVAKCGTPENPGLRDEFGGKKNVLVTHPLNRETGCVLSKKIEVPAGKKTTLRLVVGHDPRGDWTLIARADGKEIFKKSVGKDTAEKGWMNVDVDLSDFAGNTIALELVNQPSGWTFEAAYWAKIAIESE